MTNAIFDSPLSFVHWDITARCNLKCLHCRDSFEVDKLSEELSTEEGFRLIDQLAKDFNLEWLSFDGGEPLIRGDILELIRHAKKSQIYTYLLTNGTLLTKEKAEQLKEAGLDSIQVSLDGMRETHDKIRGSGNFDKAVLGIKNALSVGLRVSSRITLNQINLNEAKYLLNFVIGLGCAGFGIRRVIPCGNAIKNISIMEPDKKEYLKVIKECVEIGKGKIEVQIGADPVLIPKTHIIEDLRNEYGSCDVLAGCGAGITMCHISNTGDVFPCSTLPISGGNIREKSLSELWKSGVIFQKLREGRANLQGNCGTCKFNMACGGCRASAYYYTGDVLGFDPYCLLDI